MRLFALLVLLPASTALAAPRSFTTPKLLNEPINVACVADPGNDDTPDCASFEVDAQGAKRVALIIRFTHSSATAVQLYKDSSVDGSPPWGVLQLGDASSPPTVSMGEHKVEWSVSSNATWSVQFDVDARFQRFRFTSTGGAAGDTVTVYYTLID